MLPIFTRSSLTVLTIDSLKNFFFQLYVSFCKSSSGKRSLKDSAEAFSAINCSGLILTLRSRIWSKHFSHNTPIALFYKILQFNRIIHLTGKYFPTNGEPSICILRRCLVTKNEKEYNILLNNRANNETNDDRFIHDIYIILESTWHRNSPQPLVHILGHVR